MVGVMQSSFFRLVEHHLALGPICSLNCWWIEIQLTLWAVDHVHVME